MLPLDADIEELYCHEACPPCTSPTIPPQVVPTPNATGIKRQTTIGIKRQGSPHPPDSLPVNTPPPFSNEYIYLEALSDIAHIDDALAGLTFPHLSSSASCDSLSRSDVDLAAPHIDLSNLEASLALPPPGSSPGSSAS